MKIIFNTSPIKLVGVKIYLDDILKKECLIRGGLYPVYVEIEDMSFKKITLETCYKSELLHPEESLQYCEASNAVIYGYEFDERLLDNEGKFLKASQFSYKTEVEYGGKCPNEIFLDFIHVYPECGQCGLCIKKINGDNQSIDKIKHTYIRRSSVSRICLRMGIVASLQLLLLLTIGFLLVKYIFIPVNAMGNIGTRFHRILVGDVFLLSLIVLGPILLYFIATVVCMKSLISTKTREEFIEQWCLRLK